MSESDSNILQIAIADAATYQNFEVPYNLNDFIMQQHLYNAAIKEIMTKLEILDDEFHVKYDHNPIHHIEFRLKTAKSIIEKLNRKNLEVSLDSIKNHLTDVAGIRVICNYLDDINKIADLLIKQDDLTLLRKRDYIETPKENGYRSLHLVLQVPIYLAETVEKVSVEIQIRTLGMDLWASLEHQLKYKQKNEVTDDIRNRLTACSATISKVDSEMQSIYQDLKQLHDSDNAME